MITTTPVSRREMADRVHAIGRQLSELAKLEPNELSDARSSLEDLGQELRYLAMWLHARERT